ncbi:MULTISPECIES: hypothetical protein [Photorhabdus]|uniref:hypothetical protein n=1 Tax=Photorhabdus TaxID=29487 RepID=UPI000943337D|nr:hypothetical protein [Photorhabdus luminescens]
MLNCHKPVTHSLTIKDGNNNSAKTTHLSHSDVLVCYQLPHSQKNHKTISTLHPMSSINYVFCWSVKTLAVCKLFNIPFYLQQGTKYQGGLVAQVDNPDESKAQGYGW